MAPDTKIAAMESVPLFARCSKDELARIAQIADEIDLPAGKVLAQQGDRGREFFVLLDGSAEVQADSDPRPPLGPGDFFGEVALVTDQSRTATVTALTPVRALVITDRAFKELMRTSPELQTKILEATADRLAATTL